MKNLRRENECIVVVSGSWGCHRLTYSGAPTTCSVREREENKPPVQIFLIHRLSRYNRRIYLRTPHKPCHVSTNLRSLCSSVADRFISFNIKEHSAVIFLSTNKYKQTEEVTLFSYGVWYTRLFPKRVLSGSNVPICPVVFGTLDFFKERESSLSGSNVPISHVDSLGPILGQW
jgi:hypothetical protein